MLEYAFKEGLPVDKQSQRLEQYLDQYEQSWPLSGTVLIAQRGEIKVHKAYGYANLEHQVPNTLDTKFRIWSLTKSFTGMAILMLKEQKRLRLEDPILKYLPQQHALEGITILHLLGHTSGIANYTSIPAYNQKLNKLNLTPMEMLQLFVSQPPAFMPGTSFAYNNSGYYLLGMIIEQITGMTFEDYITTYILQPLGMVNTGVYNNQQIISNLASPYHSSWGEYTQGEYIDMSSILSAGAMYSTAADLFLWDQALYSDQLVSHDTLEMAFHSSNLKYRFGWFLDERLERKRMYHGGAYRGFRSELHRYPEDQTSVIMLTNYDCVPVTKLTESLAGLIFGEPVRVPISPQAFPLDDSIYADYMGTYEGFGCKASVERSGQDYYFVWNDVEVTPFYPISETRFHHTKHDSQYEFKRNAQGELSFLGMQKS
jgi:CubicO group peptidase (beta-lactamase class C family)